MCEKSKHFFSSQLNGDCTKTLPGTGNERRAFLFGAGGLCLAFFFPALLALAALTPMRTKTVVGLGFLQLFFGEMLVKCEN